MKKVRYGAHDKMVNEYNNVDTDGLPKVTKLKMHCKGLIKHECRHNKIYRQYAFMFAKKLILDMTR